MTRFTHDSIAKKLDLVLQGFSAGRYGFFADWLAHGATVDGLKDGLAWLRDDPLTGGYDGTYLTRAIGLTPDGVVPLTVTYYEDCGGHYAWAYLDGKPWDSCVFRVPAETDKEKIWADDDGMLSLQQKICFWMADAYMLQDIVQYPTVKDIAAEAGLSCRKLAERFDIPRRTMEDWCAGKRTPPAYVLSMMRKILGQK